MGPGIEISTSMNPIDPIDRIDPIDHDEIAMVEPINHQS